MEQAQSNHADAEYATPTVLALTPQRTATLYAGAMIVTLAAALAFAGLFALRLGLGDSPAAVGLSFAFTVLPVWLSAAAILRYGTSPLATAFAATAGIFGGMLLPLAGLAAGLYAGFFICALVVALIAAATPAIWRGARSLRLIGVLAIGAVALLLLLYTVPLRLFLPEAMTLGIATTDSYFHAAIAQMIAHHGHISIGADGLVRQHYHFLSHAIAAGYAKASGMDVPHIYLYWGALTLKLQFVWAFFCAGILLFQTGAKNATTGTLTRLVYAWLALILVGGIESESFIVSLTLLVGLLPLLMALMQCKPDTRGIFSAIVLLTVAAIFCAGAKASAGYFAAIGLVVIAWRFRAQPIRIGYIGAALAVLATFTYIYVLPRDLEMSNAPLSIRAASYLQYATWQTIVSYALPILVILILAWQPRMRALGSAITFDYRTRKASTQSTNGAWLTRNVRRFLAANALVQFLILCVLGCAAVLVGTSIGSNNFYFSSMIYTIALLLMPAALYITIETGLTTRWVAWLTSLLLVVNIAPVLMDYPVTLYRTISDLYKAAQPETDGGKTKAQIMASLKSTHKPFATLKTDISHTPWARLESVLATQAQSVQGRLAVHIAPSALDVWQRLESVSAWWCMAPHLMVPAETGLIEIRSVAPQAVEQKCAPPGILWYGFGANQDEHRTSELSDNALCALARPLKIRKVYRLVSYKDLSKNSVVSCE